MKKQLFKSRVRYFQPTWQKKGWEYTEFQCPMCKVWFGPVWNNNPTGLKIHIASTAKRETTAKMLGEIKKTPHFDFWKKYTVPESPTYRKREWTIF